MYYVFGIDVGQENQFVFFTEEPDDYDSEQWDSGRKLPNPPPNLTLVADEDGQEAPSDLLLTDFDFFVASPKLISVLSSLSVENIEYYPINVVNGDGDTIASDYKAMLIIGRCACLDKNNATLRYSADNEDLLSVKRFSVLENKIVPIGSQSDKPLIFRLDEFPFITLVHESVKKACEDNDITGVEFIQTTDYM